MPIIPTLYLSVKYILSQNPSVITWIYGSATCSGISGICFGKYMSVMKLFLKFELKYCNLSSSSYYLCIMILEFVYILWFLDILCGLINQDRWLCRNWQVPLIYQDYLQLKFLALVNEIYKTYQEARDGYDSSVMLISETAVIIISAHCIFFLLKKKYHTNDRDLVSSVQVKIYHAQPQIQALLSLNELTRFHTRSNPECSRTL